MEHQTDINMYKGLASYFLPDGVLDCFDVVDFAEGPTLGDRLNRKTIRYVRQEEILKQLDGICFNENVGKGHDDE